MRHDEHNVTSIGNAAQLALAKLERGGALSDEDWDSLPERAPGPTITERAAPRVDALVAAGWPKRYVVDASAVVADWPLITRCERWHVSGYAKSILILAGGVGSGKSTAATWWGVSRGPRGTSYLTAERFAALSRYEVDDRSRWERVGGLVLDDVGVEYLDGKGAALGALEALVERFYADVKPLLITTNLTRDGFVERVGGDGSRIVSRLRGAGSWFGTQDKDHRRSG